MFAPPKLLVLILMIVAVWYGLRWLNGPPRKVQRRRAPPPPQAAIEAEDLVACGVCGAYVSTRSAHCGRPDCPRPR